MVELVVSVPARNRFSTVDTKLSERNSAVGTCFSLGGQSGADAQQSQNSKMLRFAPSPQGTDAHFGYCFPEVGSFERLKRSPKVLPNLNDLDKEVVDEVLRGAGVQRLPVLSDLHFDKVSYLLDPSARDRGCASDGGKQTPRDGFGQNVFGLFGNSF